MIIIKRVLFIGMSPNRGGIETYMMNIFLNLENKGFHFDFLNNYKNGIAYSNEIKRNGGTIRNVIIPTNIFGHLVRAHRMKLFLSKHHNYDIVHVNAMSINAIFWLKMANKFNIRKLIIQSHVDNRLYKSFIEKICTQLLSLESYHYLKRHHNITELAVNDKSGKWMFKNNQFNIISNGINVNKFKYNKDIRKKLRKKFNIKNNDKVIITVARLTYQKNYFRIIKIFLYIHNILKDNVKLIIVGDGPELQHLKHFVTVLHLQNNVIFLGSISYVYKVLNIADLMLMPSRYEGFPFCLIEAQSVGVPALVSTEAIPKSSDVTGTLTYISLKKSNIYWAKYAIDILNKHFDRYKMNNIIKTSKYNLVYSIRRIKEVYLNKK